MATLAQQEAFKRGRLSNRLQNVGCKEDVNVQWIMENKVQAQYKNEKRIRHTTT